MTINTEPFVLTLPTLKSLKVGAVIARGITLARSRRSKEWEPAYWIAFKQSKFNKWTIRMTFLEYIKKFKNYQEFERYLIVQPVSKTGAYSPTLDEFQKSEKFGTVDCDPDVLKLYIKN